jgi:trigger factor
MPGDEFDFDVTFPADYHNADLAGVEVTFKCKVHYIIDDELIVPELNDEFVSENFNYTNVDEFLIAFRRSVELKSEYAANTEMYQALWEDVVEVAEIIDYPGQEVERLYSEMRLWYEDYAEYYGTDYDTFIKSYLGYEDEDLVNLAKDYVKEDLVMYQLIKENNIALTDEDYEDGIKIYAELYGITVDELISYYGEERVKNTLLWEALMADILEDSVITE